MSSAANTVEGTTTGAPDVRQQRAKSRGVSALMYAAQQGNVDRVRRIIRDQSSSLFARDRTGKSALHYCCTSDNVCSAHAADLLVMAAPDLVEEHDEDGFTPLHLAVIAGNMQLVTFLLANNADVRALDNEKHTVVHWATVCGETAALRAVLSAGAPISTPDVHGGYPLHYAAQMCGGVANDKESSLGMQVLQTLLSHSDIVVSVMDGDKRQPLLWAASAGSSKAVLALVRAGAAVEAADKDGLTALHCAASRGHTDCLDTLLTLCGASPDVIDSNGCTALHYAVTLGHADATALLLAHGADPNRQDRKGRSPAHCGCAKGQFETVKMIGSHGANLWLRNARGDLPLHEAAASGRRELVKCLLEMRPSQVNARNNDGRCPLHMAALNDNADMCKILLDAGAQVNPILRTSKNIFMTPLDCALQRGFRSTAKYLQLHGGVPANRLASGQHNQAVNNALNLQIRDDVTFWGGSSSDSERENLNSSKGGKRTHRKKVAQKYEMNRESLSGSDVEKNSKLNSTESRTKKKMAENGEKRMSAKKENQQSAVPSSRRSSSRKLPTSRLDYTNEIIINGKTEINIHQTSEIIIDKEPILLEKVSETVVPSELPETVVLEKNRRPKSAKYSKVKSGKSTVERGTSAYKDNITSPETAIQQTTKEKEFSKELSLKDQSTNTSEETLETVIENKIATMALDDKDKLGNATRKLPDQQSLMSNTSEDIEAHKDLIVEASVHAPPKSLGVEIESQKEANTMERKIDEVEDKVENNLEAESVGVTEIKQLNKQPNENQVEDKSVEDKSVKEENLQGDTVKESDNGKDVIIDKDKEGSNQDAKIDEIKQTEAKEEQNNDNEKGRNAVEGERQENPQKQEDKISAQKIEDASTKAEDTVIKANGNGEIEDEIGSPETEGKSNTHINKDSANKEENVHVREDEFQSFSVLDPTQNQEIKEPMNKTVPDHDQEQCEEQKQAKEEKIEEDKKILEIQSGVESKLQQETVVPGKKTRVKQTDESKKKQLNGVKKKDKEGDKEYEDYSDDFSSEGSSVSTTANKTHKSFRILDEGEVEQLNKDKPKRGRTKKNTTKQIRSRSMENKAKEGVKEKVVKRSKIPTPLGKTTLSKSDRHLDKAHKPDRKTQSNLDGRIPSLPNIHQSKGGLKEPPRSESNMSAPLLTSLYSDIERDSVSDVEEGPRRSKKRIKKRSKVRDARSAGSDYESSNLIDSGFEPSPRSTRIPKWKNMSERGVNMTSVTQSIQTNIRRYHLERKIFQHLLELKRLQIRADQHNEAMLVKRAIDAYHQSCASTVGAGRYIPEDFSFKSFEKFLYESLRKLQKSDVEYMKGLPAAPTNPLLCTRSTNRCMHATHAYTGIPCAAYLPKMDHHTIPKVGFNDVSCKPGTGFLPNINPKKAVTLELSHGSDKQIISLPTDRLDQNKRYYVTFTVKGRDSSPSNAEDGPNSCTGHRHSKSD